MARGLSPEQAQALADYRQRWQATLLSQGPTDRAVAERGIRQAYAAAGLSSSIEVRWCRGPRELARSWRAETSGSKEPVAIFGDNVRQVLVDRTCTRMVSVVEHLCGRALRQAVSEGMRLGRPGPLGAAVVAATLQAIDEPGSRALWPVSWRQSWWRKRWGGGAAAMSRLSFRDAGYSAHELNWLGAFRFLHDVCGIVEAGDTLAGLWQVADHVGWVVPHEHVCWLSERHDVLAYDANERLHCGTGPALAYPDGTTVHMWKGVQVPAALIEHPERITARMIDRELDPVVRRCMIEIVTPERYIAMGSAVRINQDDAGVLWRKLWWGFDAWAAVEVVNGTPEPDGTRKHYFLQVPPTVRTAREAVAWTYGMSEQQYARLKMRT